MTYEEQFLAILKLNFEPALWPVWTTDYQLLDRRTDHGLRTYNKKFGEKRQQWIKCGLANIYSQLSLY